MCCIRSWIVDSGKICPNLCWLSRPIRLLFSTRPYVWWFHMLLICWIVPTKLLFRLNEWFVLLLPTHACRYMLHSFQLSCIRFIPMFSYSLWDTTAKDVSPNRNLVEPWFMFLQSAQFLRIGMNNITAILFDQLHLLWFCFCQLWMDTLSFCWKSKQNNGQNRRYRSPLTCYWFIT